MGAKLSIIYVAMAMVIDEMMPNWMVSLKNCHIKKSCCFLIIHHVSYQCVIKISCLKFIEITQRLRENVNEFHYFEKIYIFCL